MLKIGAYLNFIIAAGHMVALFFLDTAFHYYGIDGIMGKIAEYGTLLPYLITVGLACVFVLSGLYALSAAGYIRKLPLLWTGVFCIAATYLLRAVWGLFSMASDGVWDFKGLSAFAVSELVGLLYLMGGVKGWKTSEEHERSKRFQ